ncbi:hypothetical protein ACFQ60_21345 [Streptomyces zhihengii]
MSEGSDRTEVGRKAAGRKAVGRKVLAPVLGIGLLVAGLHLRLNTNVLGEDEVCGGLVPTAAAAAVFPSSGRVSDGKGLDDRPGDRLAFSCTVESSSFLPGSDTGHIRVTGTRERGDFPFTDDGRWPNPATVSYFAGDSTGGVGADHGWVLLPAACTTADGGRRSSRAGPRGIGPGEAGRAPDRRGQRGGRKGRLRGRGAPGGAPHARRRPGSAAAPGRGRVWSRRDDVPRTTGGDRRRGDGPGRPGPHLGVPCGRIRDLRGDPGAPRRRGHPVLPGYEAQPAAAGHAMSGFDPYQAVTDCAGTPTYFSMETGPKYHDATGTPGTPRLRPLFDSFVAAAGDRFGCSAPTS